MSSSNRCHRDSNLRVLQVTDSISRLGGGLAEIVLGLSRALERHESLEVEVDNGVLAADDSEVAVIRDRWRGLPLRLTPSKKYFGLRWAPELERALRAAGEEGRVIHLHGIWGCAARALARAGNTKQTKTGLSGERWLISPQGMLQPWALRQSAWKKWLSQRVWEGPLLRSARCLHALSIDEAESFRELGLRQPIAIIPNGVSLPSREGGKGTPKEQRGKGQRRVLLFLGRLHPLKGLPELIEAWRALSPELRENWELKIAGWDQGGHEAELRRQVAAASLGDSVVFAGPADPAKREALFREASAFVLPSRTEGMPMALLEAWASGLPVAMTRACHLDLGAEQGAGVLLSEDPSGRLSGLETLLHADAAELDAMGERGRALVEARFRWEHGAERFVRVYAWLAGAGEPDEEWFLPGEGLS